MARTLEGIMADARITQTELAEAMNVTRSTFCRKLKDGSFDAREIAAVCAYMNVTDPALVCEIFLLLPSHYCNARG